MHIPTCFKRLTSSKGRSGTIFNDSRNSSQAESLSAASFYGPGDKFPPLKYRRPVTKEHRALLEGWSFPKPNSDQFFDLHSTYKERSLCPRCRCESPNSQISPKSSQENIRDLHSRSSVNTLHGPRSTVPMNSYDGSANPRHSIERSQHTQKSLTDSIKTSSSDASSDGSEYSNDANSFKMARCPTLSPSSSESGVSTPNSTPPRSIDGIEPRGERYCQSHGGFASSTNNKDTPVGSWNSTRSRSRYNSYSSSEKDGQQTVRLTEQEIQEVRKLIALPQRGAPFSQEELAYALERKRLYFDNWRS